MESRDCGSLGDPGHVVHVIARLNLGGPAAIVASLLDGLPDREMTVVAGRVSSGEVDSRSVLGTARGIVDLPSLGRSPNLLNDVTSYRWLRRFFVASRPRAVHTHTAKAGVLGRLAARRAGVPRLVHTYHGHLLSGYFPATVQRTVIEVERRLAHRSDLLVAVGRRVRDDLLAAGIGTQEQFRVIAPGVRSMIAVPQAGARQGLRLGGAERVVLYVGRLVQVKRSDRVLHLARKLPDVMFLIAGDGPLRPRLQASAPANVRFLGWRADVAMLYSAADLALLTSDNEGMPLSLIEAALCGIPAVTTDVGSAPEVVLDGVTGAVVPADADALVAAVERLLSDDSLRGRLGEAARVRAQKEFSVERMVQAHVKLYRELMEEIPSRR